ncbi:SAG-related sequence [Besnoitia besnoiti]|uniref:SAG-related sequence n=1 Tax=Besnoitia besnoiti TaxID=94643 RepID=A0A2A9MEI2_BESBE|nr:SAG-related sequence [Besnoitia besnoiti]PFH34083.1 SAG-related sequence [Besnoitia besnoiti]
MVALRRTGAVVTCLLAASTLAVDAANVKDIVCPTNTNTTETVTLNPGESFSLSCAGFTSALPPNFIKYACSGTGANCAAPGTAYTDLFPKATDHVWVTPNDSSRVAVHTWTAPDKGKLDNTATVFSVGCEQKTANGDPKTYQCYVDVTVSAATPVQALSAAVVLIAALGTMMSA